MVFDALDADLDRARALPVEAMNVQQQLAMLERCEKLRRQLPAVEHPLINSLTHQATPEELGGTRPHAIAEATLISRAEASRRVKEATDLGPRHGLTGEPLAPILPATAAAQRAGTLGAGHVAVIRKFFHRLPGWVDAATRDAVEADLAAAGTHFRPEQLADLAEHLADCLNPDGTYTDEDRARRRGLTLGKQGPDGMSELRGSAPPKPAPPWRRCWPSWPHPACATPSTTPRAWTAPPANKRSTATPAAPASATTTDSLRA